MAYCRCDGVCQVYMYASYNGYQFHLSNDSESIRSDPDSSRDFNIPDGIEALRRLKRLQVQGFGVPQYAIDRLQSEIDSGNYQRGDKK